MEIILIELGERKNCWYRDFAILIDSGKGLGLLFTTYPDHFEIYIPRNYKFYYN